MLEIGAPSARPARLPDDRSGALGFRHRPIIAARLLAEEPQQFGCRGIVLEARASWFWPRSSSPAAVAEPKSTLTSASARIAAHSAPNKGWPRSRREVMTERRAPARAMRTIAGSIGCGPAAGREARRVRRRAGPSAAVIDAKQIAGHSLTTVLASSLDAARPRSPRAPPGGSSDRAPMAAGEGDQVLVGLLGRAKPRAQLRQGLMLEGMNAPHGGLCSRRRG